MNIEQLANAEFEYIAGHNKYLVSLQELEAFAKALLSSEPVAWLDDYSDVITDKRKKFLLENGCGDDYHIPLFTHPPATVSLEKYNRAIEALKCIDEDLVNPVYYRLVKEAIAEAELSAEGKEG